MQIRSTKPHQIAHRGPQVSRSDRYRGKIKVTPQDIEDHLAIKWDPQQVPSQMVRREGDRFTLSNFRWGFQETGAAKDWTPQWAQTELDTSKVKDVYLTLQPFSPELVAAHGLILFEMESDDAVKGANGERDFGLALSVEARSPEGQDYDLLKGLKKTFGQIYQLGSLSDQLQKVGRQRGHKLVPHRLNLEPEAKKQLLQDSLEAATQDRLGEWYHLLTNSCITADIDLINGVVPQDQQMARWSKVFKFSRPATMLPVVAGATLKSKGLLADEPVKVINPDSSIFPDIQQKKTALHEILGSLSRGWAWKPGFVLAGAGVGGVLGHALGSQLGPLAEVAGSALGLLGGSYLGDRSADLIAVKTDIEVQSQTDWYAQMGGLTVEDAKARIKNPASSG